VKRSRAIAALAGGAALSLPRFARAQATTVRIGTLLTDNYCMGYYAQDGGFFGRSGLSIELTPFSNGAAMAAACAGGSIDVGTGESTELANGVIRGLPFVIVAGGALWSADAPTTFLCVARNSTIRTAKALEGATIAVPALVSLSATAVKAWLAQGGADLTKVRFVELKPPEMAEALSRGTIDAAHLSEPPFSFGLDLIVPIAEPQDTIAKRFLISNWFATRDWLAHNPESAQRLVAAAYETARWANTHHADTLLILAKYAKLDVSRLQTMKRATYATSLDARLMQPVLDAGFQFGALPRRLNAADLVR